MSFANPFTGRRPTPLWIVVLVILFVGCEKKRGDRKETTRVTGQVYVDGVPVPAKEPLKILCHNVAGMDKEQPYVSQALTGEDGKFEISTYEKGDGIPAGEYVLTFMWGKMNFFSNSYGGPDKLKGRYKDPKKSEHRLTVEAGKPTDLGRIDLKTK
jgi:hypothetical protein